MDENIPKGCQKLKRISKRDVNPVYGFILNRTILLLRRIREIRGRIISLEENSIRNSNQAEEVQV